MKKFLCICEGGVNRSVALGYALKRRGQDAVAGSWRWNSPETLTMLAGWADYVVLMQREFVANLPDDLCRLYGDKVRVVDVGVDRYGAPLHPELLEFLQKTVAEWESRGFSI